MTPIVVSGTGGCALSDLRTELQARGFGDLSNGRADDFLNQAYRSLLSREPWPFLETTTSGTAPLTISDLRQILHVRDTTTDTTLEFLDVRELYDIDADVDQTGSPEHWWLDGATTLRVWPLNTSDTIAVRYVKRANNLTADGDTTIFPSEWCYLVLLGAQAQLLSANQDNVEEAAAIQQQYDREFANMQTTYFPRNYQSTQGILSVYGAG